MWFRARLGHAILAVVLLGGASGEAAPRASGHLPIRAPQRLTVDPEHGIVTLGMVAVPDWKVGTFALAADAHRFERWWLALGFPNPVPSLDFARHGVVFFVEAPLCDPATEPAPYPGRGGLPVVALHLFADERIVPEFFPVSQIACTDHLEVGPARGIAYAVRVPRAVVSRRARVALGPSPPRESPPPQSPPSVGGVPPGRPHDESAALELAGVEQGAPLPARGEARVAYFRDGTPLWVVRHLDDRVTVLGATRAVAAERAPGLRTVVTWSPEWRTFLGAFDEHGRPLSGWGPGLERYASRVSEGRVFVERRPAVVPAGRLDPDRALRPDARQPVAQPFRGLPAATLPNGELVTRDGIYRVNGLLRVDPAQPATLCVSPGQGASRRCVSLEGVAVRADCRLLTQGAFVVRRGSGEWHLVSLEGGDWGLTCTDAAGDQVWPSRRGFPRVDRPSFAAHAAGLARSHPSGLAVGGEWELARRWPLGGHPFVRTSQVRGEVLVLSARARVLTPAVAASSAEWQLGLQTWLYDTRQLDRHLNLTSPLGLVLPELGVAGGAGRSVPYASWRFAAAWVLRPGYWRQRPYGLRERLEVNATPTITVRLDPPRPSWQVGMTLGMTVW